jgi:hypothetical protein
MSIVKFPLDLFDVIINNLFSIFNQNFKLNNEIEIVLFLLFFIFIFSTIGFLFNEEKLSHFKKSTGIYLFITGFYFFSAAAFPYIAVGLKPSFNTGEYASRHQILLVIGASLLLYSLIIILTKIKLAQTIIVSLMVSIFIISTIKQQTKYITSWLKQEAIECNFRDIPEISKFNYFCIIDNTVFYNETPLFYNMYVYTGIYKKITDTQDKYFSDIDSYGQHKDMFKYYPEHKDVFNCQNLNSIEDPEFYLLINKGVYLKSHYFLIYIYQYYFDRKNFNKNIRSFLEIKLIKITNSPNNLNKKVINEVNL